MYVHNDDNVTNAIGEFGVVYKAHMFSSKSRSDRTLVAVKTLNGQCFSFFC